MMGHKLLVLVLATGLAETDIFYYYFIYCYFHYYTTLVLRNICCKPILFLAWRPFKLTSGSEGSRKQGRGHNGRYIKYQYLNLY